MNANQPKTGGGFVLPIFNTSKESRRSSRASSLNSNRLPFLDWIPDSARNHFVATSAEFVGTTLFLFFGFSGTQVALLANAPNPTNEVRTPSDSSQILFIALSFGFSLAVNAWLFFRISGGLFNPAVTLSMCLIGALPYTRGLLLATSQILAGITSAAIVSALFPGPLKVHTTLGGGTSITQGLFIEMFLTAELVFTILMLTTEKHKGTFIAPIGIGLSLFIAELTGVYFTSASLNPARSLGPSVVTHSFEGYHWIYWLGPILGSLLASGFYKYVRALEYETLNPIQDQDLEKAEDEQFNPDNIASATQRYAPCVHHASTKDEEQAMESKEGIEKLRNGSTGGSTLVGRHGSEAQHHSLPTMTIPMIAEPASKFDGAGKGEENEMYSWYSENQNQVISTVSTPGEEFIEEQVGKRDIGARGLFIA